MRVLRRRVAIVDKKFLFFIMLILCIGVVHAYCYQESANVSNQTGIDGSCGLNYSGSYYAPSQAISTGYIEITYIKPKYAVDNNTTWVAKFFNNTYLNLSIPQDCWNANNNSLIFRVRSQVFYPNGIDPAIVVRYLSCYNGSAPVIPFNTYKIIYSASYNTGFVATNWNIPEGNDNAYLMTDGNWSSEGFVLSVNAPSYFYWASTPSPNTFDGITENAWFYEEAMNWSICVPNWVFNTTSCSGGLYSVNYYDSNHCGTVVDLPYNNGTTLSCTGTSACYQESTNQSMPFDGSCSLNYGGNYYHVSDTNFERNLMITYMKPPSATGGTWIAKVQNNTYLAFPIPQDCWNFNSSAIFLEASSYHGWYSFMGDYVRLSCANTSFSLPYYAPELSHSLYYYAGVGRVDNGDFWDFGWDGDVVDGNWSTFDFAFDIGYGGVERGVWAGAHNYQDYSFLPNTKYSFIYEEAMSWNLGCVESWVNSNSVCNGVNYTVKYTDTNMCGTTYNLPVNNGTVVSCLVCSPSWIQSIVPSTCTLGYMTKVYSDANYCNTTLNLPFDNGTISSCNIFSSISPNHTVKLWDNFTILTYAPVGSSVNISLQYPNLSSYLSPTSWNGVAFESQSFNAYPNGTYNMTGYAGNQSISGSLVVTDFEAVIPTQFDSVVSAGSNFTFLLKIFTDSSYTLNHSISCTVPVGFSCIVQPSVNVLGSANVTLIVTSNVSVPDGLYAGSLVVTRLLDGRTYSASLPLGISTAFGVAQIDNPSTFSQIMYSNEIKYKNYTVTNVGNYNLTDCYVSVDGSFAGQSFVVGSNNFSIAPNESGIVSVAYVMPSSGIYTGYFNVFCVASVGGFVNGLSNPQLQQLFVIPYLAPYTPPTGGGGASVPYISLTNYSTTQVFSLLNKDGSSNGYVSYSYALDVFSKTFVVQNKVATLLNLKVTCRGDFCQYVKFSKDSFSLAGFGTDFFTATISVPSSVTLNGVYSYEVVLTDGSGNSISLVNQVHISTLSAWYSKFALITKEGDRGFWFSIGGFAVPKLLLYLLLVLIVDGLTVLLMPKNAFYKKNIVLILTFASLVVFGLSALIY
jgi:hypothetical protein